jgi:HipA-like protein
MTNELIALANGREMGSVIYRNARLSFIYEESWRQDGRSFPLSLSMPLASAKELKRLNWTNPFDEEPSRN